MDTWRTPEQALRVLRIRIAHLMQLNPDGALGRRIIDRVIAKS